MKLKSLINLLLDGMDLSCQRDFEVPEKYDGWMCLDIPKMKIKNLCIGCLAAKVREETKKLK